MSAPEFFPSDWYVTTTEDDFDPLMRHQFEGIPWGPCVKCLHPVYHEIHRAAGGVRGAEE